MPKTPKTITITESHQLLSELLKPSDGSGQLRKCVRNYTMAVLMLDAGLRVGEVTKLRVSDLVFQHEPVTTLCVRREIAKGGHERLIPLSSRITAAITEMHENQWWKSEAHMTKFAFIRPYTNAPLTVRQVQRIIKIASKKAIGREIHPHILRHTFASKLMRQVSMRVVQELLGHKNIANTQIYTHPNGQDLKNAIDNMDS